ncbi:MAG: DNA methyltransferase [Kiritimatiellia bacterium]
MIIAEFIAKWRRADLKERSAAQEHFIDLCSVFEHPTPAAADPTGESFCFEKGIAKHGGGNGFADVWKRGYFGWEYKGKHKDLSAAHDQLLRYRDALANPPLLVLCDLDRIIVRTNFTGTVSVKHEIALEELGQPRNVEIMRAVFHNPERLRPGRTSTAITQDAARRVAEIAAVLRERGHDPTAVAHFLDRIIFCLFAEDAGLLPEKVFTRILEKAGEDSERLQKFLSQLFGSMATGGDFGLESIRHFNGTLFEDPIVLELTPADVKQLIAAAALDWSFVDPSIFGTLFERGLDPAKRSQLGAHFTGIEDIELVVDAIVMQPLRMRWHETRSTIESLLTTGKKVPLASVKSKPLTPMAQRKARGEASSMLHSLLAELQRIKILDPACGSGNFLYVALLRLKDLEKEVILYGADNDLGAYLPLVGPWQLYGIEINPYAHDLAQMTVWIGWLQWIRINGFGFPAEPILRSLSNNIRLMDAIMQDNGEDPPSEPEWPAVDYIVGNPPFLGGNRIRQELGSEYVDRLFKLYAGRIPAFSDLCCYWFEKARAHIEHGKVKRAGLLATQGIRGGANRTVLKRIKETGDIFWAESDRPWILDGANVHVSIVGFDNGEETTRALDGKTVSFINANLTATADTTEAHKLPQMLNISFIGTKKAGQFNITEDHAFEIMSIPNPHGKPNSDILKPWLNGTAIVKRPDRQWIIDCGVNMSLDDFKLYDHLYQYVLKHIKPERDLNKETRTRINWWLYKRNAPEMRIAVNTLVRYIATPRVSKHRLFSWFDTSILPDDGIYIFARSDDLFFGILHSRFHELWALAQGTQLREKESGFRYTPTTCFETFPFPPGVLDGQPQTEAHTEIARAAKELNELRENWLNPPEWTKVETLDFLGTVGGPWDRYIDPATIEARGAFEVGTVRYPRLVARDDGCVAKLKQRTLTNLYNQGPAWLTACHAKLDTAVAAAYGWPVDLPDDTIIERLLALNLDA